MIARMVPRCLLCLARPHDRSNEAAIDPALAIESAPQLSGPKRR